MSFEAYARMELLAAGMDPDSDIEGPDKWFAQNVLELIRVFAEQGHSGSSAPDCIKLFAKIANFEPIRPLTGEDSEWLECWPGLFQNKRCPHVFKEDGEAYDSTGRVFRDPDGSCCTNFESRVSITFPYTPKIEYVDRP